MDYTIEHALNHAMREHPLLVSIVAGFANWGVVAFGVAVCALWLLDAPRRPALWRRAFAAGMSAAALGLLVSQVITHLWDRPRPAEAHPLGVIPLITPSLDASFPSDHATAAFAIAFGILFVTGRAGWLFLAWAALIGTSRVLAGVHYPSDVLAGALVGLASGFVAARVAMPLLVPLVSLASRVTDPLLAGLARLPPVREIVASASLRRAVVLVAGGVLLVLFALRLRAHLLDEMPLSALAAWMGVVALGAHIAGAGSDAGSSRTRVR